MLLRICCAVSNHAYCETALLKRRRDAEDKYDCSSTFFRIHRRVASRCSTDLFEGVHWYENSPQSFVQIPTPQMRPPPFGNVKTLCSERFGAPISDSLLILIEQIFKTLLKSINILMCCSGACTAPLMRRSGRPEVAGTLTHQPSVDRLVRKAVTLKSFFFELCRISSISFQVFVAF